MLLASVPATAAPDPVEFYRTMLDRGILHFGQGNYRDATKELRSAAFGLVEFVDSFETAQIYLAMALQLTGRDKEARQAIASVVAAERIEDKYATLPIPADIRERFEALAQKLMADEQMAILHHKNKVPARTSPSVQSPPVEQERNPVKECESQLEQLRSDQKKQADAAKVREQTLAKERDELKAQLEHLRADHAKEVDEAKTREHARTTPRTPDAIGPRLAAAEQALSRSDLASARAQFSAVLEEPTLDRTTILRCGEGLYRALDFRSALAAFDRAGSLRPGEEMFGYYAAVACYETGQYAAAKKRLAAVISRIGITPEIERYRAKIEGANK